MTRQYTQEDQHRKTSVEARTTLRKDKMGQGVSTETEDKATQMDWLWLDKGKSMRKGTITDEPIMNIFMKS